MTTEPSWWHWQPWMRSGPASTIGERAPDRHDHGIDVMAGAIDPIERPPMEIHQHVVDGG